MIIVHMKSGKSHELNLTFSEFEQLNNNNEFDRIAAKDYVDRRKVYIVYKSEIESIELSWDGKIQELVDSCEDTIKKTIN